MTPANPWRFWWIALGTAWAFDLLFWDKLPGVSVPLWALLILGGVAYLSASEKVRPARAGFVLAVLALLLSVVSFWRAEPFTRFMNIALALGSLLLLAASFRKGYWPFYRLTDYLLAGARLIGGMLARPAVLLRSLFENNTAEEGPGSPLKALWRQTLPVLRGLLLALPVVIVLALLLSSADQIFEDWLNSLLSFLDLKRLPEYLFRGFYVIFILTSLLSGAYLHALLPQGDEKHPAERQDWLRPFLGWVESVVVLVSVNLLFAAFVIIQFQYLFGGQANINAAGYTYSEYARRGFGELVAVAVISLLLYTTLCAITRQDDRRRKVTFSILAGMLMTLVLVMLGSAYLRLSLYEQAYGFTRLRAYTHVFIIWLGLLLAALVVIEALSRRERLAIVLLVTAFGFTLSLAGLNVDGFIAAQNIERARAGEALDASYLSGLSSDAVPVMLNAFHSGGLPQQDKEALGRELTCRIVESFSQDDWAWPSFHLGEYQSGALLLRSQDALSDYRIIKTPVGYEISIRGGEPEACRPTFWDDF